MAEDLLAKYKVKPPASAATPVMETPAPESTQGAPENVNKEYGYKAFHLLDKGVGDYLSIGLASGMWRRFNYNWLVEIADDGDKGTQIALVFNFGPVVFLYGRNLQAGTLGLTFRRVESIVEYVPALWPKPEASEPIVEKIEIRMKDVLGEAPQSAARENALGSDPKQ